MSHVVDQYFELRKQLATLRSEFKRAEHEITAQLDEIESRLLLGMEATGQDVLVSPLGQVKRVETVRFRCDDWESFSGWILDNRAAYQPGRDSSNNVSMRPAVSEIHVGNDLDENVWHFDVSDSGTLTVAGFKSPNTRAEIYESVAHAWVESPAHLVDAMDEVQPLAWAVNEIYSEVRSEVESERDSASNDAMASDERVEALTDRLDAMPEEPDEGAREWLLALTTDEFERLVVPVIENWFTGKPNWNYEDDYIPRSATSQGAALEFFESMDGDELDLLGVEIIEGDYPGSTYYAAELRGDVDAAKQSCYQGEYSSSV